MFSTRPRASRKCNLRGSGEEAAGWRVQAFSGCACSFGQERVPSVCVDHSPEHLLDERAVEMCAAARWPELLAAATGPHMNDYSTPAPTLTTLRQLGVDAGTTLALSPPARLDAGSELTLTLPPFGFGAGDSATPTPPLTSLRQRGAEAVTTVRRWRRNDIESGDVATDRRRPCYDAVTAGDATPAQTPTPTPLQH